MRHVGDPEPGPRTERGVRFYEGDPDDPRGQWVRVLPFENEESRQAFYHQVAAKVEGWNREKPGHRMPEMVFRKINPWSTDDVHVMAESSNSPVNAEWPTLERNHTSWCPRCLSLQDFHHDQCIRCYDTVRRLR